MKNFNDFPHTLNSQDKQFSKYQLCMVEEAKLDAFIGEREQDWVCHPCTPSSEKADFPTQYLPNHSFAACSYA